MSMKSIRIKVKSMVVLLLCLLMASCANTTLTQSWKETELKQSYKHPMIIGISDSQQTRRIYENYIVAQLKKKKVVATPSHTLINSKQIINRDTVVSAIQGTDIDSVLLTYLVSADSELKYHDSPLNVSGGYSGSADSNMMSSTLITNRGRYSDEETIVLKNDFYDAQSQDIVWSAQTQTVAADSIDEIIVDVSKLLVTELFDDEILK